MPKHLPRFPKGPTQNERRGCFQHRGRKARKLARLARVAFCGHMGAVREWVRATSNQRQSVGLVDFKLLPRR